MNIGFLVTARLKSERLPLKILKSIKGKPLLSHMINRIKLSKYVNKIIVCTSKKRQDDKIEKLCKDEKINCYRGHAEDVLLRLYEASKKFNLDYIVNITADCPLVEPYYIDQICKTYKKKKFDLIRAFDLPHGSFSYGIKIPALKKIINIKSTSNTAAWEKYFTDTGLFKIHDLKIKNKLHIKPGLRMTLDYPEDLEFLKKIFNALYDKNKNLMTATGNVIINSKKMTLKADKVIYDKKADQATAIGNVIIEGDDGSIYKSEEVILTEEFKAISAIPLFGTLKDKSNIMSKSFKKTADGSSYFKEGIYTACDCNLKNNDPLPIWTLSSKEIRHKPAEKTIYHKHVTMKLFSFPVLYIPYLSHPDWTVKRRSGFLAPTLGTSGDLGAVVRVPYFFNLAPHYDLTITPWIVTKGAAIVEGEWRQRFKIPHQCRINQNDN